ncbi:MAG: AraC family transcriptional regulator [Ignavibacteriae bacterium]|nr:AraC family transcriptional regulator [Ignavibacteriota bacterium]
MIYKSLKIPYPLSRYADTIYYLSMNGDSFKKNIIPDGKTDIIFNLNSNKLGFFKDGKIIFSGNSVIQGLRKKNFEYVAKGKIEMLGIRLMPFGIYSLFNVPLKELPEDPVELSLVAGKFTKELEQKLIEKQDIDGKFGILFDWLMSLFVKREERNGMMIDAVYKIYSTQGKSTIKDISKNSYNYYKKIQRSFHGTIGISPKLYARMVRFESIHNTLVKSDKIDWLEIVTKYDFYDQSHLSKEFQFFTGHSPQEFVEKMDRFV